MKKLFVFIFSLTFTSVLLAQTQFGLKLGLSSEQLAPKDFDVTGPNGQTTLNMKIKNARYGYHFGALLQAQIGRVYIVPEVLYNSNRVDYRLQGVGIAAVDSIKSETYRNIDIPIMLGVKLFGPIIAKGGVVSHLHLAPKSDLTDIKDYKAAYAKATWGYQAGIAMPISNHLLFEVRYEGNLAQFGDHITFYDKKYSFDQKAKRVMFSVGYRF